jgi:hypothetical protein
MCHNYAKAIYQQDLDTKMIYDLLLPDYEFR